MYKSRIAKWGLDKKNKENEVRAIVWKKTQRDAVGKSSAFKIRAREVDLKDVERYLKRKNLSVEDIIAQWASSAPTPPGLVCLTPPHIPASPRSPETLAVPERILANIRNYFLGSFEAGTWISRRSEILACISTKKAGNSTALLKDFNDKSAAACRLLNKEFFMEAGLTLVSASAGMKDILLAEHPHTLACIFDAIDFFRRTGRPELAPLVLRQFADLAAVILPGLHPLGQICKQLIPLDSSQLEDVTIIARQGAIDCLGSVLGPMHYSTLLHRLQQIEAVQRSDCKSAETALRALLRECESASEQHDRRSLQTLVSLATQLSGQARDAEIEEIGRVIVAHAPHVNPRDCSRHFSHHGFYFIALAQRNQHKIELAEASLREALDVVVSNWGWQYSVALEILVVLETWLTEWGKYAEAAEVRDKIKGIVASMDATL
jgi:hypothetical protein